MITSVLIADNTLEAAVAVGKTGLGGLARSLSPFGVVDREPPEPLTLTRLDPQYASEEDGTTIQRRVQVFSGDNSVAERAGDILGRVRAVGQRESIPGGSQRRGRPGGGELDIAGRRNLRIADADGERSRRRFRSPTRLRPHTTGCWHALPCNLEGAITSLNSGHSRERDLQQRFR